MEKDQGTRHVLFQDHEGILDKISHDSLILFAFCREYHKVNEFVGVDFVTVQYVVMCG
jgi:hypothetical protein